MNENRLRSTILAEMLKFQTVALRSLARGSPFGFARSVGQWYVLNKLLGREKEDPFKHIYEFVREHLKGTNDGG